MAIEDFPTRTSDSLGEVKSNKNAVTVPTKQYSAPEYEVLATRIIQLFTEVGKTDGSTVGSIREGLKRLQALRVANVATEGDLWNKAGSLNTDANLEEGAVCYVDGVAAFVCSDPTLGSATWARLGPLSGAAVSVLGRSANSSGVVADIAASANDRLLARVSDAISFVQLSLGMVPDSLLTKAKLENSAAVSVLGRSANSSGVVADIAASANDRLLARVSDAISFVQLSLGMVPDSLLTKAKLENSAAVSVLGRSANSSGVVADIAAAADDRLLARTSSALSFTQLTAGMVGSSILTWAMMAAEMWTSVSSSGVIATAKTANYTVGANDWYVPYSTNAGTFTITFPTAVIGRIFVLKKTDTSANGLTLDPTGSNTIDGTSGTQTLAGSTLAFKPSQAFLAISSTAWVAL